MKKIKKLLRIIGPGIITGAADDDPSGIATYAQTGAQFGYGQLWTMIFLLPLLIAIQEICGRIGVVSEAGIAAVIKKNYNKTLLYVVTSLILIANTINIGANVGAMAESVQLLIPLNFAFIMIAFTLIILTLEVFLSYKKYANILKWLCLSLLAYPITFFIVKAPWLPLLKATFIPHIEFHFQFLYIITGVFGTTISTVIGLCLNFLKIPPFKLLIFSAVINGIVAVPLIFIIAMIDNNKKIMGNQKSGFISKIFIWLCFLAMGLSTVMMGISFFIK